MIVWGKGDDDHWSHKQMEVVPESIPPSRTQKQPSMVFKSVASRQMCAVQYVVVNHHKGTSVSHIDTSRSLIPPARAVFALNPTA